LKKNRKKEETLKRVRRSSPLEKSRSGAGNKRKRVLVTVYGSLFSEREVEKAHPPSRKGGKKSQLREKRVDCSN